MVTLVEVRAIVSRNTLDTSQSGAWTVEARGQVLKFSSQDL